MYKISLMANIIFSYQVLRNFFLKGMASLIGMHVTFNLKNTFNWHYPKEEVLKVKKKNFIDKNFKPT